MTTRAPTQLLVIDCKTLKIKAFEGKEHIDTAQLEIEEGTPVEDTKTALNGFRLQSTLQSKQAREQAEHVQQVLNARYAYADMEVASWYLSQPVVE